MRTKHNTNSKVGVYVRVSTFDQAKGIQSQELALSQYLQAQGMSGAVWYRDRLSGASLKRPEFLRLQKAIFNGEIKTVICWKLDRLSRSLQDGVNLLSDWLNKDVRVIAVSQQLDFSGTVGQMIASVLFAVAQMERENLRENTKRGMAAAKARGVKMGKRPSVHAEVVTRLLQEGLTVSDVARRLDKTRQAVYLCLRRAGIDITKLHAEARA